MCGTYEGSAPAGEWVEVTCSSNAHGRYLIIQIPGARQILTLCEVQVCGARGRWSTYYQIMLLLFFYHVKMHVFYRRVSVNGFDHAHAKTASFMESAALPPRCESS